MKRFAIRNKINEEWYAKSPKYWNSIRWSTEIDRARLYKRLSDVRQSLFYVKSRRTRNGYVDDLEIVEFDQSLTEIQAHPPVKPKPVNHWDPVVSREVL